MKLKDIFATQGKVVPFSELPMKDCWFPHIDDIERRQGGAVAERLDVDGRFQVRAVQREDSVDGMWYAATYALWLDGQPVAVVSESNRSSGTAERWIVDAPAYHRLGAYLWQTLQENGEPALELADMEQDVQLQVLFQPSLKDMDAVDGPVQTGYVVLKNYEQYMHNVPAGLVLIAIGELISNIPEYLRRGSVTIRRVRALTQQEQADNPSLSVPRQSGHSQMYWYEHCSRPADAKVVPI